MMKRTKRTLQDESGATSLSAERAAVQLLAAQRMAQFLDGLPREFADPNAPPLTQKDIIALFHVDSSSRP